MTYFYVLTYCLLQIYIYTNIQFTIKLPVFKKKKHLYYNVGNKFVWILELEMLFPNINEGINCNIFLPVGCGCAPRPISWLYTVCNESHLPVAKVWICLNSSHTQYFSPPLDPANPPNFLPFEEHKYQIWSKKRQWELI